VFSPTASVVEFDGTTAKPIALPDVAVYSGTVGDPDTAVSIFGGRPGGGGVRGKGAVGAAIHPRGGTADAPGTHVVVGGDELAMPDRKICDNDLAMPGGSSGPPTAAAPPPTAGLPPAPTL